MKHIESIQPEYAAFELDRIGREETDATATAALTALLHNVTGCDIPQTDTTPQSDVDELVPLAVSILRRHWTTPLTALGDGTTPMSLADLMRRLILGRVDGNEALGIPPANANISTAVSALRERKIGGVPDAPDGLSLPRLLCDSTIADTITELIDDNIGWVMDKTLTLPSTLTKLVLGCKGMTAPIGNVSNLTLLELPYLEVYSTYQSAMTSGTYQGTTADFRKLREVRNAILPDAPYLTENPFRDLEIITPNYSAQSMTILGNTAIDTIELPKLKTVNASCWTCVIMGGSVRVIKCEALVSCTSNYNGNTTYSAALIGGDLPNLEELWLGKLTGTGYITSNSASKANTPNLIKVVLGEGTSCSVTLNAWNPTTALAERLDEFLSNFRLYIADRLSDNGSGKTLTLSQEVRDAIHSAGIDTIITNKGWTISPVPTQQ